MREHIEWCSECWERLEKIGKLEKKEQNDKVRKEIIKLCREGNLCIVNHTNFERGDE